MLDLPETIAVVVALLVAAVALAAWDLLRQARDDGSHARLHQRAVAWGRSWFSRKR